METKEAQDRIAQAVADRGYVSTYPRMHVMRAMLKMLEEATEVVVDYLSRYGNVLSADGQSYIEIFSIANEEARALFDELAASDSDVPGMDTDALEHIKKEAADVAVTLADLSRGIEQATGEPFDVMQAALAKSGADLSRGVRAGR